VLSITIVKTAYFINLKNKLMTRAEALKRTREKFTNLLDGKALPNVSITEVILYYETLVAKNAAPVVKLSSGILDNFREAEIQQYEQDNDEWYGQ
jgi:hypothetical protein